MKLKPTPLSSKYLNTVDAKFLVNNIGKEADIQDSENDFSYFNPRFTTMYRFAFLVPSLTCTILE